MERLDEVWKNDALVRQFVDGVRGGIPLAAEQLDVMLRVLSARGEPVTSFADVGCGSGVLAASIVAAYPRAAATLVDFSEPMLAEAERVFSGKGHDVCFVRADLGMSSWCAAVAARAPFDAVVSGYAIHHQPDSRKRELYAEIATLLRPGGTFINVEHVASPTDSIAAMADNLLIDSLWGFHRARGGGKTREQVADEFVHRPDKSANILAPVEVQCEWLRGCGFIDVDCYFKIFELAVFGGRRA